MNHEHKEYRSSPNISWKITGFLRDVGDSTAHHAHEAYTYYPNSHHCRIPFALGRLWLCTVSTVCPFFTHFPNSRRISWRFGDYLIQGESAGHLGDRTCPWANTGNVQNERMVAHLDRI
jgi:hypothetical protein